jgi:hypothetical protein
MTPREATEMKARGISLGFQANPSRAEKAAFRKLTVTVPPEAYERLVRESARRKIAAEPNQLLSALVREAIFEYLKGIGEKA